MIIIVIVIIIMIITIIIRIIIRMIILIIMVIIIIIIIIIIISAIKNKNVYSPSPDILANAAHKAFSAPILSIKFLAAFSKY